MLDSDAPGTSDAFETAEIAPAPEVPAAADASHAPEASETVGAPQPVRRRRAASRPAGPPAAIVAAQPPAALPPVPEAPELAAVASEASVPEQTLPCTAAQQPRRPARKRASRPAGPPSAAQPESAVGEPSAPVEEPSVEAVPEAEVVKPKRTRRRRTVDEAAAELREPAAEQPQAEQPQAEPIQEVQAEPEAEAETDAVAASLAALERERPRRAARHLIESAGATARGAGDVASALDSLAAAIGAARPAEEPEEEDEDQAGIAEEEAAVSDETDEAAEAEEEPEDEVADEDAEAGEESDGTVRRRRRRRGGRRRRRGTARGDDEGAGEAEDETAEEGEAEEEASEGEAETESETAAEGSNRRRRRRRRRGEDAAEESEEAGVDVVVRVREPRRSRTTEAREANDQITGIEGSTRMEAKKQRRREGRAAGRRRAPILSEAEFLARRESVDRTMVIRQRDAYTQIGVLEDGILVEHYVDRDSSASMIGNIYLGRVQNVLPSMEAAFVDIGRGRNAVLYAGEVDWDSFGATGSDRKVEKVLKSGQAVLVQVTKDPVGAKGARLTSHISIPGRYVVYSPGGQLSGISRKLPENERQRLKGILDDLVGENASVIVRTAAEGASEEELVRDVNRLKAQWEIIEKKVKQGNSPQLLYSEPDLTVRIVRDLFTEDFRSLIVDGNGQGEDAYDTVEAYVTHVAPHLQARLVKWNRWSQGDLFEQYRVDEQVAKALERKVHLPSGGSLIIDRTEAMTVIDVNTGKFTGTQGNLEATVTSNNLEAAEEIVRQLRLRDIGGIIVIDFIDMVLPSNRELLLRRLVECLGRDRTRHQVAEVTSLGLVQMTRKKIGTGLAEAFTVVCETCKGRGYHIHDAPVASQSPSDGGDRDSHSGGGRRPRGQSGATGSDRGGE